MPEPTNPDRLRIAFVITELSVGGAERCLTHLVTSIDRARFAPHVFSLWPRPNRDRDALVQQLEAADVPIHFLNARSIQSAWSSRNVLKQVFRELRIDLLQNFLFRANVLGTSAARAAGVPHVVLGVRVADPPYWRMWFEKQACRHADRIVCVSDSVAEFVEHNWADDAVKLQVIPNGIELDRYPAASRANLNDLGIPAGQRVLITVGRLHKQKGLDWLLQCVPELLRRLPDHDLLLVGDGPERDALREQAETHNSRRRVHFSGWRMDIPELLAASEMLLLPSRWEGMPNVLLEAMASKLPVLATRVEGVEQVLGDLAREQTVAFGASEDFIEQAVSILANAARLSAGNRSRIESEFSLRTMIDRYEQLYSSLARR